MLPVPGKKEIQDQISKRRFGFLDFLRTLIKGYFLRDLLCCFYRMQVFVKAFSLDLCVQFIDVVAHA